MMNGRLQSESSGVRSSEPKPTLAPGLKVPIGSALGEKVRELCMHVCTFLIFIACLSLGTLAGEMEHITVYRDDTLYHIIPWLLQLKNGDLVLTVREAHARSKEQRGHVDPTARGILLRSRDGGRTWGEKVVIDDETYRFSQTEDVILDPFV